MTQPKFRRRKEARPAEIVAAAQAVFSEKGFAAAKIDEIALRAGVSKGAVYLYFATKEDLFRAVVHEAVSPNIDRLVGTLSIYDGPIADLARIMLPRMAALITDSGAGAVLKMVVGESRNFPELAKVWHDEVAGKGLAALTALIARAQERGEVRPGDPRLHALSLMGPMVAGVIWRETFTPVGGGDIDLVALAGQHIETATRGLLTEAGR